MKKLMVMAVLVLFMTGSAYAAAEWNFYGHARVNTFVTDFDNSPFTSSSAALGLVSGSDTQNFEEGLYGNARIGANIKVSDSLSGRFEYGAQSGDANVRILWGEWDFGAGKLGVGKHYTPLLMPYSNQVYSIHTLGKGDHNMSTFGMLYGQREAMIQLEFGTFKLAFVEPRTTITNDPTTLGYQLAVLGATSVPAPDTEVKFPNIQAKYRHDFDWGHISVAGGFQSFEVLHNGGEYDVTSYVVALGGRVNWGGFYFKGDIWGGQNAGNLADILVSGALWSSTENAGSSTFDGAGWGLAHWTDGTIPGTTVGVTDNDALAGLIVVGYTIREGLYLEAGYGYVRTELDVAGAEKNDAETFYLQSTIFFAPGVFVTPEIGVCDMKQVGEPEVFYFGAKWQINF